MVCKRTERGGVTDTDTARFLIQVPISCSFITTLPSRNMCETPKVKTAVHGCNYLLSVWTLLCRCLVKLSTSYQPYMIVF